MSEKLFRPTKKWLSSNYKKPKICDEKNCHCKVSAFNEDGFAGFCFGIELDRPNNELDIISFCVADYDKEKLKANCMTRYLFHPVEALNVAMFIMATVGDAWYLLPEYRKKLGVLQNKRTKLLNKIISEDEIKNESK